MPSLWKILTIFLRKYLTLSLKKYLQAEYKGVKICDISGEEEGFSDVIKASLDIIKDIDPRRFKRVKNEIHWILTGCDKQGLTTCYNRIIKACSIHFEVFQMDQNIITAWYAGLIIYEATTGMLISKGFKPTRKRAKQFNKIILSEKNRFYKRFELKYPEYAGTLIY